MTPERGEFWLADETEQMIAEATMHGSLSVNENGGTTVILHNGDLNWKWKKDGQNFPIKNTDKFDVVGFLPAQNKYVWLQDASLRSQPGLYKDGGTVIGSYLTLFSTFIISGGKISPCIKRLMIPLGPLLPWLNRPRPKSARSDEYFEIRYPNDLHDVFQIKRGSVTVRTETSIADDMAKRAITVEQQGWIDFEFSTPVSLEEAKDIYVHLEDLFVLLTDEECGLDWPKIELAEKEDTGTIRVYRRRLIKLEILAFKLWVLYSSIRKDFGIVVDSWLDMRTQYGAAFHLYLAVRRGESVYLEHRFANLIWGLESFYRKENVYFANLSDDKKQKIAKICEATKGVLKYDERRKLKKCLERAEELALGDKLFQLFSELRLPIQSEELKAFAVKCADWRNDISHFGGPRTESNYGEFAREVFNLMGALDILYHTAILKKIGISDEIISDIFCKSFKSEEIRVRLRLAGLSLPLPPSPQMPLLTMGPIP